jgi:hypothetical protein
MKHALLCFCIFLLTSALDAQQTVLLFTESFDNGSNTFSLNAAGVGTNTGNNSWEINDEYNGAPVYANTISQDSVVSGTINGAPHSNYLHIRDEIAVVNNSVANCNWDPADASDHFAFTGNTFCTLGLTDVTFTFFWICEGNADAYGEVYYRVDGGQWIQTGQTKYNNQHLWKYEVIQDPAFNNAQNLQFGFRWVNATGGTANAAFGVDDVIAVGTFPNTNPVTMNVSLVSPNPVCQQNFLTIGYNLSRPLCDGTYQIEMSDATGSFASPINGGTFNIFAPDTSGFIGFQVPNNVSGNCFKLRINRLSPAPQITGTPSVCVAIQDCPESIITNAAPVMNDADTTCILSVIDVKFNSFGVFGPGAITNVYTAQLSDDNGSFATPVQLGTLPSDQAFPASQGNISGLIPANVPPGCGYYIRVVSSSPSTVGTTIGPFCITQCDVLINNHTDLHYCIPQGVNADGLCHTLTIHPNQWNNQALYNSCNNFTIELRDATTFALVNSGGLGAYHSNGGGAFLFCTPGVRDSLPVPPGAYYMRVVSDCSTQPWNQTSTVIRITIGAPDTIPPLIVMDDTIQCNGSLVALYVNPFNHPPSDYEWASDALNNGNPFLWPYNPLLVDFSSTPPNPGRYRFYVREKNFGCYGPYSAEGGLWLIEKPQPTITGPNVVCVGDTVSFNTSYYQETYYNWHASGSATIFEAGNNESQFVFNTTGNYTVYNYSINDCGSDSASSNVTVISPYHRVRASAYARRPTRSAALLICFRCEFGPR